MASSFNSNTSLKWLENGSSTTSCNIYWCCLRFLKPKEGNVIQGVCPVAKCLKTAVSKGDAEDMDPLWQAVTGQWNLFAQWGKKKVQIFQFCPPSKIPISSQKSHPFYLSGQTAPCKGKEHRIFLIQPWGPGHYRLVFSMPLYLLCVHLSHLQGSDTDRETDPT